MSEPARDEIETDHQHAHPHEGDEPSHDLPSVVADGHAHPHVSAHVHEHDDDPSHHDDHDHDHRHDHEHASHGLPGILAEVFHAHHHEASFDPSEDATGEGIRTLWLSLIGLGMTALIQLVIALSSGSVGLLADTIHNFSDALTSLPLWFAFLIGRWPANRRYTYGYGRAEDLAGVAIVLIIFASAVAAFWEAVQKLVHPTPIDHLGWVMAAAVVGFLGNEGVSILRIRTGQRIGSAALEADGYHARVDGFTSLGVLVGAIAVALGFGIADPIVGLLISAAILFVSKDAAVAIWHRIMDAVDPPLVQKAERVIRETPGVAGVDDVRLRWSGHRLLAEGRVLVAEDLSVGAAHDIAEEARHRLFHALPSLADATLHLDPTGPSGMDYHERTEHHRNEVGSQELGARSSN